MLPPIPLCRPWIDAAEVSRVSAAVRGRLSGDGPICRSVERRLAKLLGAPRVLLTSSCTHALELALLAIDLGPGQEVICPSFTFTSCANAILRAGARPVFADIEPATLGLDPASVRAQITPRTAAIMPVHYAGIAADMDALLALAAERGLKVVEDAAHALGATLHGQALGTLGEAGCFSFHETKNLTCGEGGALVLKDARVAAAAEIIREKGTNRNAFLRGEVDKYSWVAEGSSFILPEILAAMLEAQLDKFEEIQRRRAHICRRYADGLAGWARTAGVQLPPDPPFRTSAHHIFYLIYPDMAARDQALAELKAAGIQASFHYVPLHSAPRGRTLSPANLNLPVTDSIAGRLLRLPLHPLLDEADIDRVIAQVRQGPALT